MGRQGCWDPRISMAPTARSIPIKARTLKAWSGFRHRLLEEIGAMAACLQGVDVIALTGGIGEHDQALRWEMAEALAWLGRFELVVVPADEEGVIARSCRRAAGDFLI